MSHAIRIRMSVSNAPDDALERIESVRDTFSAILPDQETKWSHVPESEIDDRPEHYYSLMRFDEREDLETILDELHENQFPSVEWYVVHSHSCSHEYAHDKYADDPDYPDGETGPCGGWTLERERGDVPTW